MSAYDDLLERREQLLRELQEVTRRLKEVCNHEWKWSQIAGDGQYCPKCGAHNYDVND